MTHVAWRQSGLPPTHVIGAGCNLESERLAHIFNITLVANNTGKQPWVIGEMSDNKGEDNLQYAIGVRDLQNKQRGYSECAYSAFVFTNFTVELKAR